MRERINEILSIILKIMAIAVICIVALWFILSVYANFTEDDAKGAIPALPNISKAKYFLVAEPAGQIFLANKYDMATDDQYKVYTLHGFYDIQKGKWKLHKGDIILNERYWGKLTLIEREES